MVSPSSAKTSAEKNAVRVRNSIARSLRATSQLARNSPGRTTASPSSAIGGMSEDSDIGRDQLAVCRDVRRTIHLGAFLEAHEAAASHDGGMRGEGKPLGQVVRDEQERGTMCAALAERFGQRRAPDFVQAGVRLVAEQ